MQGHSCTELFKQVANWMANFIIAGFCLVVLWLLLQVTTYASFKVPSGSMEPTLRPGDYVLVNKWIMGGRVFNVLDALEDKQVGIHRLPGWREAERGDVLVFNYPYPSSRPDSLYMDVMLYYVKRCIALPGDTLKIHNAHYYVNGIPEPLGNVKNQDLLYEMLRFETPEALKALGVQTDNLWDSSESGSSLEYMPPTIIPREGIVVQMTERNMKLYHTLIEWETGQKLKQKDNGVFLGEECLSSYTFKKDYYFMAGDNAAHSNDSRYWGLVPEEYIVGVATHIWKSQDSRTGKIRWERVMKRID